MEQMQTKSAAVEIKTNSTPGEFTAVISAIGNVDRQGDRVMPGAFKSAIDADPIPPVYWAHQHLIPPIGEGLSWREKGDTVEYDGCLFVGGDDEHQYAKMVYAGMKSRDGRAPAINQFSYTYGIPEGGAERVMEDGKAIRLLHEIRPVAEVGPCFLGANPATYLAQPAKQLEVAKLVAARKASGSRRGPRVSMKELLAETLGVKDYGDIDGWEIRMLLDMIDSAVSFIQFSDEDDDTVAMQGIAQTLVGMLTAEFAEVTDLMAQGDAIDAILNADTPDVSVDVTINTASVDQLRAALAKKEAGEAAEPTPDEEPDAEPEAAAAAEGDPPAGDPEPEAEDTPDPDEDTAEKPADDEDEEDDEAAEKSAVAAMSSDSLLTVRDEQVIELLSVRPTH